MTHVMLDLETWGTAPGSALRSIGACTFSPYGEPHEEKTYYANIEDFSCDVAGLKFDLDTIAWWARQGPAARARLAVDQCRLGEVATEFHDWFRVVRGVCLWSNGANFDEVLWRVAVKAVGYLVPWKFWNVRDTRTCWDMAGLDHRAVPFEGVAHDALADARHQAKCVTMAYQMLGLRPQLAGKPEQAGEAVLP